MPSRAVGMGMCPRCGRPGTVVIKAGNYVYVKHGNTWHYIGTIDKVNLNKILIKQDQIKFKDKTLNIHYRNITIYILLSLFILIIIAAIFIIVFNIKYIHTYNTSTSNDSRYLLLKCNIISGNGSNINIKNCTTVISNYSINIYNLNVIKGNLTTK